MKPGFHLPPIGSSSSSNGSAKSAAAIKKELQKNIKLLCHVHSKGGSPLTTGIMVASLGPQSEPSGNSQMTGVNDSMRSETNLRQQKTHIQIILSQWKKIAIASNEYTFTKEHCFLAELLRSSDDKLRELCDTWGIDVPKSLRKE